MMNTSAMGTGMWILWIIVVVAVLMLAKLMVVGLPGRSVITSESPLGILQKCYASGDINQDEFERMKKELDNK